MVMPYQMLVDAVRGRAPIILGEHVQDEQFQPATIDLRVGDTIDAISASFLPRPGISVADYIGKVSQYSFHLSRDKTHHLDVGKTYIVPLAESCAFPDQTRMFFSPKSSTGRNDVFVRVLVESYPHFDRTPWGFRGGLWLEITPRSFHVGIRAGQCLVQGRVKTRESHTLTTDELLRAHTKYGIVFDSFGKPLDKLRAEDGKLHFHLDLQRDIVGFRAKRPVSKQLDFSVSSDTYQPRAFWHPIPRPEEGHIVLNPGDFYLLATAELIRLPSQYCGELMPYDPTAGEFRAHSAGFFDNGFGGKFGTTGVLEVRENALPFAVEHGQPVCAMAFEQTFEVPERLYGAEGSSYTQSGPSLSKQFSHRYDAWTFAYWASKL